MLGNKRQPPKDIPSFRLTQSIDLISSLCKPFLGYQEKNSPENMTAKFKSQQQLAEQKPLNSTERELINQMAKVFINNQSDRPGRIFVRINQMSGSQAINHESCRINKIQINRQEEPDQSLSGKVIFDTKMFSEENQFSFRQVPQLTKIIMNTAEKRREDKQRMSDIKNQQRIIPDSGEEQIKSKNMSIVRKVSIGFRPQGNFKYPQIYTPTPAGQTFMQTGRSGFQDSRLNQRFYAEERGEEQSFSNLIQLDLFQKQMQISQRMKGQAIKRQNMLSNSYARLQKKLTLQINTLQSKLNKQKQQMATIQIKAKDFKDRSDNLSKQLQQANRRIKELKLLNDQYIIFNAQIKKKLDVVHVQMREMRKEMQYKEQTIHELKNNQNKNKEKENQNKNKEKSHNESYYQNGTSQAYSNRTIPLNRLPIQRGSHSYHQPFVYYSPNGMPVYVVNPIYQEQVIARPNKSIIQKLQSPRSTPNLFQGLKSGKSSEHFIIDSGLNSRESSRSHSNISNLTKRSSLQKIGFIKKPQRSEKQGVLLDYMAVEDDTLKVPSKNSPDKRVLDSPNKLKAGCLKR